MGGRLRLHRDIPCTGLTRLVPLRRVQEQRGSVAVVAKAKNDHCCVRQRCVVVGRNGRLLRHWPFVDRLAGQCVVNQRYPACRRRGSDQQMTRHQSRIRIRIGQRYAAFID